jgi:hypothetical protein
VKLATDTVELLRISQLLDDPLNVGTIKGGVTKLVPLITYVPLETFLLATLYVPSITSTVELDIIILNM